MSNHWNVAMIMNARTLQSTCTTLPKSRAFSSASVCAISQVQLYPILEAHSYLSHRNGSPSPKSPTYINGSLIPPGYLPVHALCESYYRPLPGNDTELTLLLE